MSISVVIPKGVSEPAPVTALARLRPSGWRYICNTAV